MKLNGEKIKECYESKLDDLTSLLMSEVYDCKNVPSISGWVSPTWAVASMLRVSLLSSASIFVPSLVPLHPQKSIKIPIKTNTDHHCELHIINLL